MSVIGDPYGADARRCVERDPLVVGREALGWDMSARFATRAISEKNKKKRVHDSFGQRYTASPGICTGDTEHERRQRRARAVPTERSLSAHSDAIARGQRYGVAPPHL